MTNTDQQILEKAAALPEPAKAALRTAWAADKKVREAQATSDATRAKWVRLETALKRRSTTLAAIEAACGDAVAHFRSAAETDREVDSAAQALGLAVGKFQISRGDVIAALEARLAGRTFNLLNGQHALASALMSRRAEDESAVAKSLADAKTEQERADSASVLRVTAAKQSGDRPEAN